jgi:hypothetical protein
MNFYNLKSIVAAQKTTFPMPESTESFCIAPNRKQPYIEPTFAKVEFETERPAVILISAVAVTGKSTLAQVLSNQTGLPLLDLGKHKEVGDHTLTGLLTDAFHVEDLSKVLEYIGKGTYGVIIDGIDEGRSKVTEKAFEAFLDDIARRCKQAANTSFVLLGRTQILEDCWIYLTDKGTATGLITILPFTLDLAREYIDAFTKVDSSHSVEYSDARDTILNMLGAAFSDKTARGDETFLSFIGYPPVLDAIVTLLTEERNYHRILVELKRSESSDVELNLLHRIVSYILRREKEQKVVPNIVQPLIADMPQQNREAIVERVFEPEEQCMRLVSCCLGRPLSLERIAERLINEKYEAQLNSVLNDHPFISGRKFRNAVFESLALATLITSGDPLSLQLALEYVGSHKYNYYFIYFLDRIARDRVVPISCLRVILGSALEFRSTTTSIELHVDGSEADDLHPAALPASIVETQVEIIMSKDMEPSKTFVFKSELGSTTSVHLGHRLSSTYVSLPCEVLLAGSQELEFTAPVEISAAKISLQCPALVLRPPASPSTDRHVLLEATSMESTVSSILTNEVELILAVSDRAGLTYPIIKYAEQKEQLPPDPLLKEKYLRLRKILMHFRAHGKEKLAKYKHKIEHERVLRNETGWAILRQLVQDGILTPSGKFYFLQPENVDRHLGVSYIDLRKGRTSDKLLQYLKAVN